MMHPRLNKDQAALLLIDVQEKFLPVLFERERLLKQCEILLDGARLLNVPIFATEQYPERLGPTAKTLAERIPNFSPAAKLTFSACPTPLIQQAVATSGKTQWILCGIETHVCVLQTALDLLDHGKEVFVVQDAVTSRTEANRQAALERLRQAGVTLVTVEMALFELLREAGSEPFKAISRLLR